MKRRGSELRQGVPEKVGLHTPGTCAGQQRMPGNLNQPELGSWGEGKRRRRGREREEEGE